MTSARVAMRIRAACLGIVAALWVGLAGPATSQPAWPQRDPAELFERVLERLEALDRGDAVARDAFPGTEAQFRTLDADGDGVLTREELLAALEQGRMSVAELGRIFLPDLDAVPEPDGGPPEPLEARFCCDSCQRTEDGVTCTGCRKASRFLKCGGLWGGPWEVECDGTYMYDTASGELACIR